MSQNKKTKRPTRKVAGSTLESVRVQAHGPSAVYFRRMAKKQKVKNSVFFSAMLDHFQKKKINIPVTV